MNATTKSPLGRRHLLIAFVFGFGMASLFISSTMIHEPVSVVVEAEYMAHSTALGLPPSSDHATGTNGVAINSTPPPRGNATADQESRNIRNRTAPDFVVLLTCSDGFWAMWLNWLLHFERLKISNLPVHLFAEDKRTHELCTELLEKRTDGQNTTGTMSRVSMGSINLTCLAWDFVFPSETAVASAGAKRFASTGYQVMMSHRPSIVMRELELGYDVIFSDVDAIWKKDPRPFINFTQRTLSFAGRESEVHLWAQKDREKQMRVSNKKKKRVDFLCPGFTVFKSCPEVIAVVKKWRLKIEGKKERNQPAFNEVLWPAAFNGIEINGTSASMSRSILFVNPQTLPTNLFASGDMYFSNLTVEERAETVIVHNNFIGGYGAKIERFNKTGLWLVADKEPSMKTIVKEFEKKRRKKKEKRRKENETDAN